MTTPTPYSEAVKAYKESFLAGLDVAAGGAYGAGTNASGHVQGSRFHAHTTGNVTIVNKGAHSHANINLDTYTSGSVGVVGNIGKVTLTNTGYSAHASVYASADGNIGAISLTNTGADAHVDGHADAHGGNVGNIRITDIGASASAYFSAYAEGTLSAAGTAVGGSVGNISLATKGDHASAYIDVHAQGVSVSGHYVGGGNIGNLIVAATGNWAASYIEAHAYSGGSIGSSTIAVNGANGDHTRAGIYATVDGTSDHAAAIGNVVMTANNVNGDHAYVGFMGIAASGNIGNITAMLTGGSSGVVEVMARASDLLASGDQGLGGSIGNVTLTNTAYDGWTELDLSADTKIGTITATVGGGDATFNGLIGPFASKGDVGAITLNFAATNSSQNNALILNTSTATSDIGPITVTGGGNTSSFALGGYGDSYSGYGGSGYGPGAALAHSIAGIDLSTFNGSELINLSGVASGVEVLGSIGGGTIIGTSFDDTITGGIGRDTIVSGDGNDTITGGAGGDAITLGNGTDTLVYTGNSDTMTDVIQDGVCFANTGADIVMGVHDGDVINLHGIANLVVANGAVQAGTTFLDGTQGNLVNIVSGSYDATTGVFTAGAASDANNDYVVQYTGGAHATDVNSLILVDVVGMLTATAATTGAITFHVSAVPAA